MTIRKRNDSWEYRFDIARVNGKRKQISKSGFKTKKECEKEALKALAYYQNGGLEIGGDGFTKAIDNLLVAGEAVVFLLFLYTDVNFFLFGGIGIVVSIFVAWLASLFINEQLEGRV